jgi:periplasmic protein TonB
VRWSRKVSVNLLGLQLSRARQRAAPATGKRTERSSHPFEVVGLVVVSAVLHAGAAYGFYSSEKVPPQRRLSSVDIDFVRPPEVEPPKPEPPPPPPPVEEPVHRQVVKRTVVSEAKPEPVPVQPAPPVDMGIEAASDDDGNLVAGKGGSGIAVPPPQPSPKAVVAAAPAPLVQAHEGANYSKNPRPAYPARAKREGWEGRAVLRVQVLTNGRPGQVTVQTSAGRQQLDDAALAAVKGWTFVPARRGGAPTSGWVTVPIEFRLR